MICFIHNVKNDIFKKCIVYQFIYSSQRFLMTNNNIYPLFDTHLLLTAQNNFKSEKT